MLDLSPATTELARILQGVRDDQLEDPTPCAESRVRDLVDHADGFAQAFTAAAAKTRLPGDQAPHPDGSRIGPDWRERIPSRLAELAAAWRDSGAWDGMTSAGGVDLPGEVAGLVALNETIVHGWDIAVATGQKYSVPQPLVEAAQQFVQSAVDQSPDGTPGLFAAPVKVSGEAPALDQLIGLSGRDPNWTAMR